MIKAALLYSLLASPTLLKALIFTIQMAVSTLRCTSHSMGRKLSAYQKRSRSSRTLQFIDARGKILIPGIIESVSQLGLMEVGMVESTNDYGIESESPFNPSFDPSIAYNPLSTHIPINRRAGITHVVIAPRGGIISGIGRSAPLTGQLEERPKLRAETAVFARVGTRAAQGVGGSRAEIWRTLEEIVRDARYAERNARLLSRGEGRDTILPIGDLAVFNKVLKRALPLVVEAHKPPTFSMPSTSLKNTRSASSSMVVPKHGSFVRNSAMRRCLSSFIRDRSSLGVLKLWPPAMTSLRCLRRVAYR